MLVSFTNEISTPPSRKNLKNQVYVRNYRDRRDDNSNRRRKQRKNRNKYICSRGILPVTLVVLNDLLTETHLHRCHGFVICNGVTMVMVSGSAFSRRRLLTKMVHNYVATELSQQATLVGVAVQYSSYTSWC